jgi:DDE superfamily endonuclease
VRATGAGLGYQIGGAVATLVDRHGIPPSGVRDLLVDYLGELKPGMDYGCLQGLAYRLVRLFWWEILQINPGQTDLRIDPRTMTALARTVRRHHRRAATPGAALHPVRDPRSLPRPRRVVPRRPRPLGHLGRLLPDPARRVPGRRDRPAPALGTDAGPHPRAHPTRHRHQEFLRFLRRVAKAYPRRKLHLVVDNYATHKHPAVRAWLERNPRITLHFTPTSVSWLNMVEIFFSIMTR